MTMQEQTSSAEVPASASVPTIVSGHGFTRTGEEVLHVGHVITLARATFEGPAGEVMERDVVHHPGAVAVVALDGDEVVLVRQYRPVLEREMLELPAGKLDVPGEDRPTAARRELVEEAGLDAVDLIELGSFHNSIGFSDEATTIYLATELVPATPLAASIEEEYLTVERVGLDEVEGLIGDGTITDAKTILGLLWTLRRLGR
ncbi:MAG TPA: NUDIX hydrolase [Acidimicrobiales bacterium]|nr:NUDIX hydrolase [Actinomycetes bacterium]MDP6287563.1 NUDIX hydrolase [Acidimicrobiales bacterium]HJM74053.1 NUDIX hydrolase [Acidimicrobiales bacterium]HJP25236.1 NUDIX hydrolase [Acidimicrobiales bacterium]